MRQTLAILFVLALVGATLANNARGMPERERRQRAAEKYRSMQNLKNLNLGAKMANGMDFEKLRDQAKRNQKFATANLRDRFRDFKMPNADQMMKMRNRMAAEGAKMTAAQRSQLRARRPFSSMKTSKRTI